MNVSHTTGKTISAAAKTAGLWNKKFKENPTEVSQEQHNTSGDHISLSEFLKNVSISGEYCSSKFVCEILIS